MKRPSPLVVFSHGSTTTRFEAWFLMESLAGHGYVVIAPDHAGNTLPDLLSGRAQPSQTIARERPLDVSFAIDQAIARSADPTDLLARTVDGSRVAVVGRSFGGFTALATASGFRDVPPDDRVDAIVPIAASSQWLSDQELAAVKVPILLLSGTKDETVPLSTAAERPWSITASRPAWRVDLEGAGHNSFTNICDMLDPLRNAGLPSVVIDGLAEEGCSPDLIPVDDAHRLTEHFVLAFLRTTLDHHPWSQRLLSPQFARRHHLPVEVEVRTGRACYGHDWRLD